MGMLQLTGMVSGFGKGVGRGLENMQNTMSSMQLLGIRDEMERARMKETWGHDEGMLQKRQDFDVKQADVAHSRHLDLRDQDQDFQANQARIGREEGRQKEGREADREKEKEATRYQNDINKLVVEKGFSQQEAAKKVADDRAKEERDRKDKKQARQEDTGKEIVLETIRGQSRTHAGASPKLDPTTGAQLKVYTDRIGRLEDEMNNVMTKAPRRAEIQKEIATLEGKQNALLGMPSTQRERPGYKFPD